MKGSKWTWIQDKCLEKGYFESARLAQEIEIGLLKAYGRSDTKMWREMEEGAPEGSFQNFPEDLFAARLLCRGCVESHNDCSECTFRIFCGKCSAPDSTFTRFDAAFEKERER